MINGEHEKLHFDFDFVTDREVFSKLFYHVDGIYPSLTRFLSSEPDPHTKIAFCFASDQEVYCKDIERGLGVLKRNFSVINASYQSTLSR